MLYKYHLMKQPDKECKTQKEECMDKKLLLIVLVVTFGAGCANTLPNKVNMSKSYSIEGVKTYIIKTTCADAKVEHLAKTILSYYCQGLEDNIKLALRITNPEFNYDVNSTDLSIDANLEVLNGGSNTARFWVGFGAGRSITTIYIKVFKGSSVIAEGRITETSGFSLTAETENESTILRDLPLMAKRIAAFVNNPLSAKTQEEH